ncbi:putative membrane protein [Bacteroides reticulotermitis]|uniref:Membrane protein n=1 Tax=Bacteroides reticulotermitis TaxID=1133319 RepID=A0A840CYY2_9BACE|nr:DUF2339 domain-containing protein [Bacteroides reticulotermitis]MBB4044556.1 putative membrane protein [Bacteroides reticulotermitis]HJD77062.1 DUF2339 domain-containing protein [Bacteroides reticulotermitis]
MEYLLLVVIILQAVILRQEGRRFSELTSEIQELKRKTNLLLQKLQNAPSEKAQIKAKVEETKVDAHLPNVEAARVEVVPQKVEPVLAESVMANHDRQRLMKESTPVAKEEVTMKEDRRMGDKVLPDGNKKVEYKLKKKRVSKPINYEKYIGENLFGKIGILILVVGIGLFVKYAIDKDWINETMRTVLGFIAGAVLLVLAERFRKSYRTFSSLLAGGASAVFYLTVTIAFQSYQLFSQTAAFVILVGITMLMTALSVWYDRRELAIISLIGGFLAPFLVSHGEGNYLVLYTYLAILNLGMFGLSLYKKWAELPLISFAFTYFILLIYVCVEFVFNTATEETVVVAGHLFLFATLFYFIFLLPVLSILKNEKTKINRYLVFVVIGNSFIYLGLGKLFLSHMLLTFDFSGLLSLSIAVTNLMILLGLRKRREEFRLLVYTLTGLAVTFVSIAIPLMWEARLVTMAWAVEMVMLLWLYVKSGSRVYEKGAFVLMLLTALSFCYAFSVRTIYVLNPDTIFLNRIFATNLFVGLSIGAFALLMQRYREFFCKARLLKYHPWNAIMLVASVLLLYYTFVLEFSFHLSDPVNDRVIHLFTTVCLLGISYGFRKRFPIRNCPMLYIIGIGLTVLLYLYNVSVGRIAAPATVALCFALTWLTAVVAVLHLVYVSRLYYVDKGVQKVYTIYLNIIATVLWLSLIYLFLRQLGMPDEYNAGFSVALAIAGFVQMSLGMRLHQKVLRVISLFTFGIVLLKLVLVDMWAMPTVGKIIVFILLGAMLLVLSFLYQKLKNVLFGEAESEDDLTEK